MNWNQIADKWRQIEGRWKTEWGNLTRNDLTAIGGMRDQLAGLLQLKYGNSREQAEKACVEFPHSHIPVPISNLSRRRL
jgi:uncharacterized protein YjbJ (UPF0337 family)